MMFLSNTFYFEKEERDRSVVTVGHKCKVRDRFVTVRDATVAVRDNALR